MSESSRPGTEVPFAASVTVYTADRVCGFQVCGISLSQEVSSDLLSPLLWAETVKYSQNILVPSFTLRHGVPLVLLHDPHSVRVPYAVSSVLTLSDVNFSCRTLPLLLPPSMSGATPYRRHAQNPEVSGGSVTASGWSLRCKLLHQHVFVRVAEVSRSPVV